jgi:hypothetical protein
MVFSLCNDGASVKDIGAVTAKTKFKKTFFTITLVVYEL